MDRRIAFLLGGILLVVAAVAVVTMLMIDGEAERAELDPSRTGEQQSNRSGAGVTDGPEPIDGLSNASSTPDSNDLAGATREAVPDQPNDPAQSLTTPVSGVVRDPSGKPVAGILVTVFRPGFRGIGGTIMAEVETDDEGHYSLRVPRNIPLVIEVTSEEHVSARTQMRRGGGAAHDLVVQLMK